MDYTFLYYNPIVTNSNPIKRREPTAKQAREHDAALEKDFAKKRNTFALCVTCTLEDTKCKKVIDDQTARPKKHGIEFLVLDVTQINERLKKHPELIAEYFSLEWVRLIFGPEHPDQRL